MKNFIYTVAQLLCCSFTISAGGTPESSSWMPDILTEPGKVFLPDYSYAGYKWGEEKIPNHAFNVCITEFGAIPDDGEDDSEALINALAAVNSREGRIVLGFPAGEFNLSRIIFLTRENIVLRGAGSSVSGTVLKFSKPLQALPLPEELKQLQEHLKATNSTINGRLMSPFSWSGGLIWTKCPQRENPDSYVNQIVSGWRGNNQIVVSENAEYETGEILEICWFNKEGEKSTLLKHLLGESPVRKGNRLWNNSERPLVVQPVTILTSAENIITLKEPLLHDIRTSWSVKLRKASYLKHVGLEHLRIEFPDLPYGGHHFEQGYNALFLENLAHSWIRDIVVVNADSAILTNECKNVTLEKIHITGRNGHYSIHFGHSYGMLAKDFVLESDCIHNPSFNTGSKLSVFTDGLIHVARLDQHCGLNHQNLFDNLKVIDGNELFKHGGAPFWYPVAGIFNTFWNIHLEKGRFLHCEDAPEARIIGLHNEDGDIELDYGPAPYVEGLNEKGIAVESLYTYQSRQRLKTGVFHDAK
jgi:hypothetical protein